MFKFNSKVLFFIATLTMLCFMPETSWAATGSIFDIISSKMIETVKDVRAIVYIVAGFGLIMFAVLAIFNKISFKHLSYICIGLFLLAVMMPFINYFSGANLQDPELEMSYGMLIDPDNAEIVGSDVESGERKDFPKLEDLSDLDAQIKEKFGNLTAEQLGLPDLGGKEVSEDEPCDGTRVATSSGKIKCCKNGPNSKGTGCKVTLGDIVSAAQSAAGAVQDALKAGHNIKDAATGAYEGLGDAWDAFNNGENIFDALGKLADSLGYTADDVGSHFNNGVSQLQDFTNNFGDAARGFTGGDSDLADKVDNDDSKFNQWADDLKEKTRDDRDNLNEKVVEPGNGIGDFGDDLSYIEDLFNSFFK